MKHFVLRVAVAVALAFVLLGCLARSAAAQDWKAGVARVNITPHEPMWMSGYASRVHPAEGKLIDLWAKALVLEDPAGGRVALVTMDLIGIDRDTSQSICSALEVQYGLAREQVALSTSHTHCGPVVGRNLTSMYFLDDVQQKLVVDYTQGLQSQLVAVVGEALANLAPARLAWGNGQATFAVNRRNNTEANVPTLREQGLLVGPVDHDVPVLSVRDREGKIIAVAFGYACHATVMDFYQWSGDYPGFAQLAIEEQYPGSVALFWAGCGADQNPLPRREVDRSREYGRFLADAVRRTLGAVMVPIAGNLKSSFSEVPLPLDRLPTRDELVSQAASSNKYEAQRANMLLAQIDAGQPLSQTYPYPVQVWQLGQDLRFVALGGEVVVDYALRLKAELGRERTWVAGYANDVMAYIPSRRVLIEGGYEGGGAMLYYGLPTVWAPEVEQTLVGRVHELAGQSAK